MKQYESEMVIGALNRISRLITLRKSDEAGELIALFVSVLRYRHNRAGQLVPLSRELDSVSTLFDFGRRCFGPALNATVRGGDSLADVFVPHYALMTFAENCLYHAFDEKIEVWKVDVSVASEKSVVTIVIRDNGRGFDSSTVGEGGLDSAPCVYGSINSTLSRLNAFYDQNHRVTIDSSPDTGTTVRLELPCSECDSR